MAAEKRIAVSKPTWKELGRRKQAGQTYDDLIKELLQKANRVELSKKAKETSKNSEEELIPIDEI